jgi:hypothetical protein
MFPWSYYPPQQPQDPVAAIKGMIASLEGMKEFAKEMDKKEKEKNQPKYKLPEFKMNVIDLTLLIFVSTPFAYLALGALWAKVLGIH